MRVLQIPVLSPPEMPATPLGVTGTPCKEMGEFTPCCNILAEGGSVRRPRACRPPIGKATFRWQGSLPFELRRAKTPVPGQSNYFKFRYRRGSLREQGFRSERWSRGPLDWLGVAPGNCPRGISVFLLIVSACTEKDLPGCNLRRVGRAS
jgi:hypothetical protein